MKFNPGKCQVINVTKSRQLLHTSYTLHGQTLEVVSCVKYLGVDISEDLSWKPHISRITGSANDLLNSLKGASVPTLPLPQLKERAYKAVVRPQLEYDAPVWDPYTQADIQKIEMVQRRVARWVLGDYSPYANVCDVIDRLGWRTLE